MSDTPKWTKETPTTSGHYWWRPDSDSRSDIVQIHGLYAARPIDSERATLDAFEGEWLGPITADQFIELASLREQVARLEEANKMIASNHEMTQEQLHNKTFKLHEAREQVERLRGAIIPLLESYENVMVTDLVDKYDLQATQEALAQLRAALKDED